MSDDGLVYTFKLRPNLQLVERRSAGGGGFRRGPAPPGRSGHRLAVRAGRRRHPERARDHRRQEAGGRRSASRRPIDHTVVITLGTPAPYLPGLMAHPSTAPLHRPSFAKLGERFARPGDQVSNGAFVLKEWLQGSYIRAARNPHYWNNAANKIDAVKYLQIADENAELRAYRAGRTALHRRGAARAVRLDQGESRRRNCTSRRSSAPTTTASISIARCSRTSGVRQALSMVIDRERLANSVLRVGELPAYGWVPPGVFNYTAQSVRLRADADGRTHRERAQAAGRGGLHARQAAALRAALQHRRSAREGGRGRGIDVEGSARRRSAARRRGVQIADAGRRPARRRHVSASPGWATTTIRTPSCST